VIVNGKTCTTTVTRLDPTGGILVVEHLTNRPVTDSGNGN
jgi:hypothetical protein